MWLSPTEAWKIGLDYVVPIDLAVYQFTLQISYPRGQPYHLE